MKHWCRCNDTNASSVPLQPGRRRPERVVGGHGGTYGTQGMRGPAPGGRRGLAPGGRRGLAPGAAGGQAGRTGGLGLYHHGNDHGAAAVVVADPLADDAAGELADLVGLGDAVGGRQGQGFLDLGQDPAEGGVVDA